MSVEFVMKVVFFVALGTLASVLCSLLWMLREAVKKGDVNAAYWGVRGIPFLPQKTRDRIILKALDNQEARRLECAKERRRDVVRLLRKIPDLQVTQTGLDEERSPSRK